VPSSAQCPVPSVQCPVPSAQCPVVPSAQCPVPSAVQRSAMYLPVLYQRVGRLGICRKAVPRRIEHYERVEYPAIQPSEP